MKKIVIIKCKNPENVQRLFAELQKKFGNHDTAETEFLKHTNFLDVKLENDNYAAEALFFRNETIVPEKLHLFLQPHLNVHYGINKVESPQIFIATDQPLDILPHQKDYIQEHDVSDSTNLPGDYFRIKTEIIFISLQWAAIKYLDETPRTKNALRTTYLGRLKYYSKRINHLLAKTVSTPA